MNGFFGRKAITASTTQRAVSKLMMTSALVAVGTFGFVSSASAADYELPTNPVITVGNGAATFATSGVNNQNLGVNQSTDRVIINWNTFNIGADASVQFYQPDANSLAVNRVSNDGQFSRINGKLTANGKVMILDPNGVMFSAGSITDVGAIIASTGDVDDARVMAGDAILTLTNFGAGDIVNNGLIKATGGVTSNGLVAFVAPTVKNNGVINAYLGKVSLAAGDVATVDLYGDGLVELGLTGNDSAKFLAENKGKIDALGGKIQMTAASAKNAVDSVVNMAGIARANSATISNGKIILSADTVKVGAHATVKADTNITAKTVDLGTTIDGAVTGSAKTVNVLSDKAKIAQGLNVVSANGTVNVGAGTYNEHLVIDKAGVTLNGANAGVDANGVRGAETTVNPNSPGVTITVDGVTVDGLLFSGAAGADGYGIFVDDADNVTLKNNIIRNTSQSGIYILNSAFANIINNNIGATGAAGNIAADGIRLVRGDDATITGNTISNVGTDGTGFGSGVYAVLSSGLDIAGNTISNAVWDGIKLVSTDGANVDGNSTNNVGRAGVSVASSDDVTISDNTSTNSGLWGVWAQASTDLDILGNNIDGVTGEHGVYIDGGTNIYVNSNIIKNTALAGIYADNVATNADGGLTIANNTIDNTGSYGMWVYNSAGTFINNNKIGTLGGVGNIESDGIRIIASNGSVIANNTITETKPVIADGSGSGIYSLLNDNIIIGGVGRENTISNTGWDGIKLQGGTNGQVYANFITNVGRAGVSAYQTIDAVISGVTQIENSKQWGIWSARNTGLRITDSNINGTTLGEGIWSLDDANLFVDNVTISNTKGAGIYVEAAKTATSTPSATLSHNKINNTGSHGIYVLSTDNAYVAYNLIGTTGGADNIKGDGVRGVFTNGLKVHGNIISNIAPVGPAYGSGVYVNYSNDVSVTFNRISKTKWDGVKVGFGDNYTVRGNEIFDITRAGISVNATTNSLVTGNTMHDLGRWGIWSVDNDNLDVTGNTITNVTLYDGITSDLDSNTSFDGNTISQTGRDGVHVTNSSGLMTISGNTISSVPQNGVYVSGYSGSGIIISAKVALLAESPVSGLYINGNSISNSGVDGVYVENATGNVEINNNNIDNSGDDGIEVVNPSGTLEISGNEISNSGDNGIYVHNLDLFKSFIFFGGDDITLNISGNTISNSNIGVNLKSINGDLNVTKNTITNSNYDGVYVENVNQGGGFYPYPTLFIEQDVVEQPSELPVRQLTIANNDIDNSGSNGIELNNVGGLVTIDSNHITNSGYNGVLAYNYSSPVISDVQGREGFYGEEYYYGSTPIELHIVNNIIENIGSGEGDGGNQEQRIANITPFGFAAVNVDVSGDGYVELSGNTLGNNFEYGLVAYSGTIDLTGATNTIQNTNIGMGFYPTDGAPESDSEEYFNYLASQLSLVNDTIGTTAFIDQSELFVDLGYGAMFAPGTPTQLDGNNATYTLGGVIIDPATNGGVTQAEYDVLESMINHYNDTQDRGQFFFNILPPVSAARTIDQKDVLRDLFIPFADINGGSLTITGLPSIGGPAGTAPAPTGGAFDPNAIEPAAGDETAGAAPTGDIAAVEPAAGGADAPCWADATASLGQGTPVIFNFGAGSSALLQDAASCGNAGQTL